MTGKIEVAIKKEHTNTHRQRESKEQDFCVVYNMRTVAK